MLLDADCFDHYATADITERWTQYYHANGASLNPTIAAVGHRGTNGMYWGPGGGNDEGFNPIARVYHNTDTKFFVGLKAVFEGSFGSLEVGNALYPAAGRDSTDSGPMAVLLYVRGLCLTQVAIQLNRNGTMSLVRGVTPAGSGTHGIEMSEVLGTTTQALQIGVRYTIEMSGEIGTSKVTKIVVDGDEWLSVTATTKSTVTGASNAWDEIVIGRLKTTAPGSEISLAIDDYYVANSDLSDPTNQVAALLGDVVFAYLKPTIDDVQEFTPSAGSDHFAMVDDTVPDDDVTYNESDTPGNVDTFFTNAMPITGVTIVAMQVVYSRRRLNGGNTSSAAIYRVGGVNYDKGTFGDPSKYAYNQAIWNLNPDTLDPLVEDDLPVSGNSNSVGYTQVT